MIETKIFEQLMRENDNSKNDRSEKRIYTYAGTGKIQHQTMIFLLSNIAL